MSPRGKQQNGLLTQQKMLRAAVALFLESGYEKTTTAKIAKAAGMTQSSFFRAFASKEALLLELVRRMFGGQFALAEQHSGIEDPVLLYAVETSLQLHIAELTEPLRVTARTRYHQTEQAATVYPAENGFRLEFEQPQRAPTPGQSVVLYQGDVVLGGGIITRVEK